MAASSLEYGSRYASARRTAQLRAGAPALQNLRAVAPQSPPPDTDQNGCSLFALALALADVPDGPGGPAEPGGPGGPVFKLNPECWS